MSTASEAQPQTVIQNGRKAHAKGAKDAKKERITAIVEIVRKLRGFLRMNCHAKRLECVQLAGAVVRRGWFKSGSKLHALQTLRAVRLRLCRVASLASFA